MSVWWWAVVGALALAVIALGSALGAALRQTKKLRWELGTAYDSVEQLQHSFNRFVPWQLVDELAGSGKLPTADAREVTVLFADLRGFTKICETLTPAETIDLLNRYYEAVSEAITQNRGHVSKFIGDGVMGLFGALDQNPWQVNDAVHAALAIVENVKALDLAQLRESGARLSPSVGVHHGTAVAGVAGSGDLLEYTVLGNTVNLAARVETLTRLHDADILVTNAVKERLDPGFQVTEKPATAVKGVSKPLVTFVVDGYQGSGPPA